MRIIWPPANSCKKCLSDKIEWVDIDPNGKLLEFSESFIVSEHVVFGLVEFEENVRVLGKIVGNDFSQLKKGIDVKLIKCGMENGDVYYEFQPM